MSKKDLALHLSSNGVPQLASYYMAAHKEVLDVHVKVGNKHHGRFRVFEDELREHDISAREYAYTVVRLLAKWLKRKGLRSIPVNTFTGDFAFNKYIRVAGSKYVSISNTDVDAAVYWSERMVVNVWIHTCLDEGRTPSFRSIVQELRPMLSIHWLARYANGGTRPIDKVLDEFCEEYGVVAHSYTGLVDKVLLNG